MNPVYWELKVLFEMCGWKVEADECELEERDLMPRVRCGRSLRRCGKKFSRVIV
jgi:hypothetical protein